MNLREIWKLLPSKYKKRGVGVALSVFVQALLNFIGLAALIPVLAILLNTSGAEQPVVTGNLAMLSRMTDVELSARVVCAGVFCIIVFKNILIALLGNFQIRYVNSLYCYFSEKLYINYFQQGLSFVKESNTTSLSNKINGVCYTFAQGVISRLFTIGGDMILFFLIWSALLVYSPLLAFIMFICFIPAGLLYYYAVKHNLERYGKTGNEFRRKQLRLVSETFAGYVEVCINNAFSLFYDRFKKNLKEISYYRERTDKVLRIPAGIIECAVAGVMILMVLFIRENASMTFSLGIFAIASLRLLPAVRNIVTGWAQLKNNSYAVEPIREMYQFEAHDKDVSGSSYDSKNFHFNDKVIVDNVSYTFIYNGEESLSVLNNFSMTLNKGEKLGIRGASGIGKTTLFNLLLGFYSPQKGQITIDGIPLSKANIPLWHTLVSYVPQYVFIIDGTIAENVAFGCDICEIDRNQVVDAINKASLFDFVSSLPDGINTNIGENGCRISEGQRQRIGIARALYKKSKVLFFDEATSSLDTVTEHEIIDTIHGLSSQFNELTIVMITHRESTLDFCDRVMEM